MKCQCRLKIPEFLKIKLTQKFEFEHVQLFYPPSSTVFARNFKFQISKTKLPTSDCPRVVLVLGSAVCVARKRVIFVHEGGGWSTTAPYLGRAALLPRSSCKRGTCLHDGADCHMLACPRMHMQLCHAIRPVLPPAAWLCFGWQISLGDFVILPLVWVGGIPRGRKGGNHATASPQSADGRKCRIRTPKGPVHSGVWQNKETAAGVLLTPLLRVAGSCMTQLRRCSGLGTPQNRRFYKDDALVRTDSRPGPRPR